MHAYAYLNELFTLCISRCAQNSILLHMQDLMPARHLENTTLA